MTCRSPIEEHYHRSGLSELILQALRDAGKDPDALTHEDLAPMDEFHIRGRNATKELAAIAEISASDHVLDVGCGIGGPSRYLAATFRCRVTGLDIVEEYCRAADMLAGRTGLKDSVEYRHGDALAMPFQDETFDVVWSQHATMNIPDKERLFREVRRVLKPGGRLALYEVVAGTGGEIHLPVPWAQDPSINSLVTWDRLREVLEDAGFRVRTWKDATAAALEWFQRAVAREPSVAEATRLGLHVIVGPRMQQMAGNVVRNLQEDRIRVVQAVLLRFFR